jgi:hypothetical protein
VVMDCRKYRFSSSFAYQFNFSYQSLSHPFQGSHAEYIGGIGLTVGSGHIIDVCLYFG